MIFLYQDRFKLYKYHIVSLKTAKHITVLFNESYQSKIRGYLWTVMSQVLKDNEIVDTVTNDEDHWNLT